ncbi:beta-1,3-galactosyltransferase 6-like [Acanthaster planci]|uniref:Hexosyltransferase n=1 Tax=Acanthaster planci TaxID=133434 RepID=A0A8B7YF50_ACAPL|nr:beta-1,3-galactosyltransferase 6-like [Acanthaster planci]
MEFTGSCIRDVNKCCRGRRSGNKMLILMCASSSALLVVFITICINDTTSHNTKVLPCDPNLSPPQGQASKKHLSAFLVILVMSGPQMVERRYTIRDTWLQNHGEDVLPRFVIGTSGLSSSDMETLNLEQKQYYDMLFLSDLKDSFDLLSSKLLKMLVWLDRTVDFQYLLKVDDDTFVRLDALVEELKTKSRVRLYWGFFDGRAHVHKSGKYKETDWVLCDRYLPFAVGGGYVLSSDLVGFVAQSAPLLKKYHAEDVSLGSWLAPIDVRREHDPRFDTEYKSRGCRNSYLVTHKQSVQNMRGKYLQLQTIGQMCSKEQQFRLSYTYNWDKPPTECCERVEGVP